ncbi:hypothetical protein EWM64_g5119 [Hericium alpestre]|uniref:Uncharacterized protein n=1 Tax=Hericium alpestre TaxID=135208 RepID=A0A4Y9ZXY6_9AGAM|nr:hypothetical protein EWM64_g5119 [Hericium alpestre]
MQDTHLIYATESLIKSAPNAHKLKKLTTTMQAIINILQKGDRRERSSSGDDYFAKDDLVKVSELSCDYARLMFWIDEMNPKQKFWNFRSIRSKVKSMEERADAVALIYSNSQLSLGVCTADGTPARPYSQTKTGVLFPNALPNVSENILQANLFQTNKSLMLLNGDLCAVDQWVLIHQQDGASITPGIVKIIEIITRLDTPSSGA